MERRVSRARITRFRCSLKNVVYDVLSSRTNWRETFGDTDWDIFWADTGWVHDNLDNISLQDHQRINHFRNHYELTRKDLLVKNLKRARRTITTSSNRTSLSASSSSSSSCHLPDQPNGYDFFPVTFSLPADFALFVEEFKRGGSGSVWIMKPAARAQGKGIFLVQRLSQMVEWKSGLKGGPQDNYICQRYISDPYVIGGRKFDMRVYVLVTSFMPLQVYLYRSGFCRFTSNRFSMKKEDIRNNMIHLTNVAVQKTGDGYDCRSGLKFSLRDLKLLLTSRHQAAEVETVFSEIQTLILRSLLAVQNSIIQDKHCFELYGYDIMLDSSLKAWLLEVNAAPSLSADTPQDRLLKTSLIQDTLDVLDMEQATASYKLPEQVGGFDLIWDGSDSTKNQCKLQSVSNLGNYNPKLSCG